METGSKGGVKNVQAFGQKAVNLALQWLKENPPPYAVFLLTQEAGINGRNPFEYTAGSLGFVADSWKHDETLLIFTRSDGQGQAHFVKKAFRAATIEQGNLYITYENLQVKPPEFLPNAIIAVIKHEEEAGEKRKRMGAKKSQVNIARSKKAMLIL